MLGPLLILAGMILPRWRLRLHLLALPISCIGILLTRWNSAEMERIEVEYINPLASQPALLPAGEEKKPEQEYEYRKRGGLTQEKPKEGADQGSPSSPSKKIPESPVPPQPHLLAVGSPGQEPAQNLPGARTLPQHKWEEANFWDGLNVQAAQWSFWIVLLFVLWTGWVALNILPVPRLGPWMPREATVFLEGGNEALSAKLAERLAWRGEAVLLLVPRPVRFRPREPGEEQGASVDRECHCLKVNTLQEWAALPLPWEMIWHGQACLLSTGLAPSSACLDGGVSFLSGRPQGESPKRRLTVIWNFQQAPQKRWIEVFVAAGGRFVWMRKGACPLALRNIFAESAYFTAAGLASRDS